MVERKHLVLKAMLVETNITCLLYHLFVLRNNGWSQSGMEYEIQDFYEQAMLLGGITVQDPD